MGAATQLPVGFITGSSSGATTFSQPSEAASSSRSAVMPVSFHSAISGPLSCTAGGALPAITSARSLASVLAVWPAIEVCSHLPPLAVNISPSLAIAWASDPVAHWCSRLVLGSAKAVPATKCARSSGRKRGHDGLHRFTPISCCTVRLDRLWPRFEAAAGEMR